MKKEKEKGNCSKISQKPSKHPLGQRLVVGLLCICLMAVSLPMKHLGLVALAAQGGEIVMFKALPDEIREQTVSQGTPLEDLELPNTLKAVCRSAKEGHMTEEQQELEDTKDGVETQQQPEPSSQESEDLEAEQVADVLGETDESTKLDNAVGEQEGTVTGSDTESENMEQPGDGQNLEDGSNSEEGQEPGDGQNSEEEQEPGEGQDAEEEPGEGQDVEEGQEPGDGQNPEDLQNPGNGQDAEESQQPQEIPPTDEGTESAQETEKTETITIEDITWSSEPEYDGKSEESYTFRPILPEEYTLAEGVELPEITVMLEAPASKKNETETIGSDRKRRKTKVSERIETEVWSEKMEVAQQQEEAALASPSTPMCGTISEDTVWASSGTLTNGELIVEPGVTLTINGKITIGGTVTIKGGGTILRGSGSAYISLQNKDANLTLCDITLEGNSVTSDYSILEVYYGKITLDDGCQIRNCIQNTGAKQEVAAALFIGYGTAVLNDIVIENCSTICTAFRGGGAIWALQSTMTINGGVYRNNYIKYAGEKGGGGFLSNTASKIYIYGGSFIDNTSASGGGCIYHTGAGGTETYLYGGYFEGNVSQVPGYEGSGAIWYNSYGAGNMSDNKLCLSGNVKFCGDGTNSGMDGIYLDIRNQMPRKILISNTLSYPVTLYLKASENYVLAEGINNYILLHERDMKKINFVDVGGSGKKWYAVLDEKRNQVYVSPNDPGYAYYVYYISNGAEGTVVDNGRYEIGDTAIVKSADQLKRKGYHFKEWNTKADGTGESYYEGKPLKIQGDTDLYAIFEEDEKKTLKADFYSGTAGSKETKEISVPLDAVSGKITAPVLKEMEGFTAVGWDADSSGYKGEIAPDTELTLTEDTAYYGVYQKDVTLSYEAKGVEDVPESETKPRYANVHNEISYKPAEFTIAPAPEREGCAFVGWNTKEDGTGKSYQAGEKLTLEEDAALYAIFQKTLTAEFYSGSGEKEIKTVVIDSNASSGEVTAPELKEIEGFTAVGWDLDPSGYGGEIAAGTKLTLTKDTSYYGVYQKDITLSYDAKGAAYAPQKETKSCRANVHDEISYTKTAFTIAPAVILAGCVFRGWNTKADGTGTTYQEGDVLELKEDATLYAMFTKTLTADFYSGGAGIKESREISIASDASNGKVTAPELKELEGFTAVGWDLDSSEYDGEIAAGTELTLTEDTAYYGIYEKDVTLSYQNNGGKENETKKCYVNVHEELSYMVPTFTIASAPIRTGYVFVGWNTEADGSGTAYQAGSNQKFDHDTVLYALWEADYVPYQVEHYQQDLEGDGYTKIETEALTGLTNTVVQAKAKKYTGFSENVSHTLRKESGKVAADGSLKLKLYYDRDLYTIRFHLNEAEGKAPDTQTVRYGGLLQSVEEPQRRGYHFKGWFLDSVGSEGSQWDFDQEVEENTASRNVTLYAKWRDETAPVLEEASFGKGYQNLFDWLIRKDTMVITVPIVEEGSGVKRAEYALIPEKGEVQEGTAQVKGEKSQVRAEDITEAGERQTEVRAEGVAEQYQENTPAVKAAEVKSENGRYVAKITIAEDFKGTVVMDCIDHAGNRSARKLLTAKGGGVIVEDNAPQIRFQTENQGQSNGTVKVRTEVNDHTGNNITGGIAKITYQMDSQKPVSLTEQKFKSELVEFYAFTLDISGAGKHTLRVQAIDNAGNENSNQMEVEIAGQGKVTVNSPEMPPDGEPKTGESSHVQVYATISMIAGFSYLLLYFTTKEHGMTEEKKQELVSRLIGWAKGKGKPKRFLALAVIFLILSYYYSIGRNVEGRWREACEK